MARGKKKEELSLEEKLEQALVPVDEQPYEVPENWCWVKLQFICEYLKAGGDKPDSFVEEKDEEHIFPVVANGIENDGIIGFTNIGQISAGTVSVSGRGTIGYSVLREYEYMPVVRLIVIKPKKFLLPHYLKYVFDAFEEKGIGSSIPQLTIPMIKDKFIPLPPLLEQQRIVEQNECLFAKLDEAKEKVQETLDGFEERKAAILHKAFTGKLTEQWRKEHGIELDSWEKRNIQSVCAMKITDGTHKTPTYCGADEGVPFISAKDVTSGKICWDNIKYIIPELHEELYQRIAPQIDDVLLAKNGTTGVAAIVEEEKIFDLYVTLAVLRPNKEIIFPRYLLNIVNSPICKNQFDEHLTGIGVPNLHLRDIKEVLLNVPYLEEQIEIVHIIDKIMAKEQQAKEIAESVLDLPFRPSGRDISGEIGRQSILFVLAGRRR